MEIKTCLEFDAKLIDQSVDLERLAPFLSKCFLFKNLAFKRKKGRITNGRTTMKKQKRNRKCLRQNINCEKSMREKEVWIDREITNDELRNRKRWNRKDGEKKRIQESKRETETVLTEPIILLSRWDRTCSKNQGVC